MISTLGDFDATRHVSEVSLIGQTHFLALDENMANLIHERVAMAREGKNPFVIARLKSGWVVIGDVQPLEGYCLLLADPVVKDLNSLSEPDDKRKWPACVSYDWSSSRPFDPVRDRKFIEAMREALAPFAVDSQ